MRSRHPDDTEDEQRPCNCTPSHRHTWTHDELTRALQHHKDGILSVGPRRYELVSQRIPNTKLHTVHWVDVT